MLKITSEQRSRIIVSVLSFLLGRVPGKGGALQHKDTSARHQQRVTNLTLMFHIHPYRGRAATLVTFASKQHFLLRCSVMLVVLAPAKAVAVGYRCYPSREEEHTSPLLYISTTNRAGARPHQQRYA